MVLLIVVTVRGQPCLTPELFLSLLLCQMELFLKCDLDCLLQTPVISKVFYSCKFGNRFWNLYGDDDYCFSSLDLNLSLIYSPVNVILS